MTNPVQAATRTHWYRLPLADPLVVVDPFESVTRVFRERYPEESGAVLVKRFESVGGVHCVAVAYLSVQASELAEQLGAQRVGSLPGSSY